MEDETIFIHSPKEHINHNRTLLRLIKSIEVSVNDKNGYFIRKNGLPWTYHPTREIKC